MTVKSADKKPEKYVGPDGKPKIRMVSVDKEVVKSEAYDEPQGQAKRIASPLQKARMDKEKADRDKDGKLKSEGKTFKDFREANTPVGQRDKMKIIDRKPHPDGGHIVTMQTKTGKTIKRHLKNGKVKDMTEATDNDYHKTLGPTKNSDEGIAALKKKHGMSHTKAVATMKRLMGEAIDMSKVGTKATIMHPVTRVSKKVDKKDVKKHVDAGWMHMGPKRNRVTKGPFKTKEGYASDAQRKAVWASKNEKGKKESVAESFDHTDHEVELTEDYTHKIVKPPSHTKKFSHDDHYATKLGHKPRTISSDQAARHDEAQDQHLSAAQEHRAKEKKASSKKVKYLHRKAASAHELAAEAHHDATHSSEGEVNGRVSTTGHLQNIAYHSTMGANNASKMVRNLGTKTKRMKEESVDEATAMTAGPKGSLGGIGKKPSMPAPRDSKRTINAPKGTARHHADMAAKHQQSAQHHERRASEHEDEGNDDKADHHYDKMQHHDNAADAHQHAQDMIKKHGADHPEAQKASKEANKHKLGESVELDEVLDTPKAMQSYKDKAKYSRDRASGSAAAKILSKGALGSHKPELDTMRKRHKGMDMVDRNAKKKTFNALRGNK